MRHHNTLFHALLKFVARHRFEAVVRRFDGDHRVRRLTCWSQFVALLYGQLAGTQSLRELAAALSSHGNRLYHIGVGPVRRSTLSDANSARPAALFGEVFAVLLGKLTGRLASEARDVVRLIDATSLGLNQTLHRWARFTDTSASAKIHVIYDPKAACPTYFSITPAKVNDITEAQAMPLEAGAT